MKATLTALTLAVSLIASGASAFDPDDLQKLKDTGNCVDCDLGMDKRTYVTAQLQNVDLKGANLVTTDLSRANLEGADLTGANLEGADLTGAKLHRANLTGANLHRTNLKNAYLWRANLEGADLEGADLSGAQLGGADLTGANLKYVFMHLARLCNTTMPDGSVMYSGCWDRPRRLD